MKIKLGNYQRHKDTEININPEDTIVAIVGKSDHGKSSIERALRWFTTDRPRGNQFIRKGTNQATVSIDNISHTKNKTSGTYEVDGKSQIGGPPDEIFSVLGLDETNIQKQHSPPFLLNDGAGDVARQLAKLIDLTKPQTLLKGIKARGNKLSNQRGNLLTLKATYELELNKYFSINRYTRGLSSIESKHATIAKNEKALNTLASAYEIAVEAQKRLRTMPNTDRLMVQAVELHSRLNDLIGFAEKLDSLEENTALATQAEEQRMPDFSKLLTTGTSLSYRINKLIEDDDFLCITQGAVMRLRKMNVAVKKYIPLEICSETGKALLKVMQDLSKISTSAQMVDSNWALSENARYEELALTMELTNLKKELGVCPMCGSDMQ